MSRGNVLYVAEGMILPEYVQHALAEEGFSLKIVLVPDFLKLIRSNDFIYQFVIVEMYMNYFRGLDPELTCQGTEAGKVIYQMIRKRFPEVPILMLLDPNQDGELLPQDDKYLECLPKLSAPPSLILKHVQQVLATSKTPPK